MIVIWSLTRRGLGVSSIPPLFEPMKSSCQIDDLLNLWSLTLTCIHNSKIAPPFRSTNLLKIIVQQLILVRHHGTTHTNLTFDIYPTYNNLTRWHFISSLCKYFMTVREKMVTGNLTFTFSLFKQQNRQLSLKDQSDTATGSKSVETKQKTSNEILLDYTISALQILLLFKFTEQ